MATFNIDWVGPFIYDPELKQCETQYGNVYKLRDAYEKLKGRADATWTKFADTVTSIGYGFREGDYALLKSLAKKIERRHSVSLDYGSYEELIVPVEKRTVVPYDTYSLAEVRSQIDGLEDAVTRHVLSVASAGVTIEQWQDAKYVTDDALVLRSGKRYPLQADEAAVLLRCWDESLAYAEFYRKLDLDRRADGDKNNVLHKHLSSHRGLYTYNQLLFIWELNRYLTNGMSDVDAVHERTGVSTDTCESRPETWTENGLISEETRVKLM